MFMVQTMRVIDGKTYTRRFGKPMISFNAARELAIKERGHVVNESGELVGQSEFPNLAKYLPNMLNISSGEGAV